MDIEERVSLLPADKLEDFKRELLDVLYDRDWFWRHKMSYSNPDVKRVKEIIFEEQFERYLVKS